MREHSNLLFLATSFPPQLPSPTMTLRTIPLLPFAVCLVAGMLLGQSVAVTWPWLAALLLMAIPMRRWPVVQSIMLMLCFAVLGAVLMSRAQRSTCEIGQESFTADAVIASEAEEKPNTLAFDLLLVDDGSKVKCYLAKDERARSLIPGDGLTVRLRPFPADSTSYYDHYLRRHGYAGRVYVASHHWQASQVSLRSLSTVQRSRLWFLRQRHSLLQRYQSFHLDKEQYAVLSAMTLGDKSALSRELRDTYSISGASHILALSGLHLGIIYTLLSFFSMGRRWRIVSQTLIVLSLWAFAFLVGLSPSVVRSATMFSVFAILSLSHRQRMSVNALLFTLIAMLMVSPLSLFDVGFQLSFVSVLSILLWHPLLHSLLPIPFLQRHPLLHWAWGLVCVSLAAQMGAAPLVAYYFGRFSTWFLLTNFIVVPAATLILYGALIALLCPWPPLIGCLSWILHALNSVLSQLTRLPFASIEGLHPTLLQVVLVYVILLASYLLCIYLQGNNRAQFSNSRSSSNPFSTSRI